MFSVEIKKGLIANCKFHIISGTKELDNKNNFQYHFAILYPITFVKINHPKATNKNIAKIQQSAKNK